MSQSIFKRLKQAMLISALTIGTALAAPGAGSIVDSILTQTLKGSDALTRVFKGQAGEEAAETIISILASKARTELGKPMSALNEQEIVRLLNPENNADIARLLNTKIDDLAEPELNQLMDSMTAVALGLSSKADSAVATCSACSTASGRAKAIKIDDAIATSLKSTYGDIATSEALKREVQTFLSSGFVKDLRRSGDIDTKLLRDLRDNLASVQPEFQKMVLGALHTHQLSGVSAPDSKALLTAILRFSDESLLDNELIRVVINSKRAKGEWTKLLNQAAKMADDEKISSREAMEKILAAKAEANGMKKEYDEVKNKNLCGLFRSMKG